MARYIDVENLNLKGIAVFDDYGELLIPLSAVRMAIQTTPTADVAPRAEVEELQAECNRWQERLKTECEYTEAITKKKVAREIFEEIETSLQIMSFHGSEVYYAIRAEDYLHYKKKYTEGK